MKVVDIADELYTELGQPSDTSIPAMAFWLRTNIGSLNNILEASYAVDSTTLEISPELEEEEKAIFKRMFTIYFYDTLIRSNLGAAAQDVALEVSADGATVRTVNKNELSKTYVQMKKLENDNLKEMIQAYRSRGVAFRQVTGRDGNVINSPIPDTYYRRNDLV